jgi:hypothetical protein
MMAEIRCPMCGKENPSELQICQFCQARLTPLVSQPPAGDGDGSYTEDATNHQGENESDSDFPEWLKDLRTEEIESQEYLDDEPEYEEPEYKEQPIQEETLPGQQEDRPDWLSSLREDIDLHTGPLDSDESGEPADPDDPYGLENEPYSDYQSDFGGSKEDSNLPDWLESLRPPEDGESKSSDVQEEDPDWLDRIRRRKEEDKREAYYDSFEEMRDEADSAGLISSIASEEPQDEGDKLPLEDSMSAPTFEIDEIPEGQAAVAFGDKDLIKEPTIPDPDWLRDLKEENFSGEEETLILGLDEIPTELQEEIQESPEEVPDWLAEISEQPQDTAASEPKVLPDWLAKEAGAPEAPASESEDMPDWLSELMPEEAPSSLSADEQPVAVPAEPGETPDWLAELGGSSEDAPAEDEIAEDWIKGAAVFPIIEDAGSYPSGEEGIADWADQEAAGDGQMDEEAAESDLAPAELPTWLEALRPGESTASGTGTGDSDVVERAGPLVGLSGVLAADSDVARPQNISEYAVKLQVSKEQRTHADLLKDMLDGEGIANPIPKQSVISTHNVLRWVIALVLFLAILWPAVTSGQQVPMPTYSQEIGDVNGLVNDLPEDARILVAFDYQPGLAAEMDTTAAAVMDHIMLRGAYLTLVSTSPTGPLVAERFLSQTQSNHNYTRDEQYINLGFIPGGAAGLLSLAVNPQRTVPYTTDGVDAWGTSADTALPALLGVERLIDFSMILVIVDDPDIARSWIEQVQPYLTSEDGGTPLVMVVSAQSEPLIRPYYEAYPRQLQGFVAGMRGGASYARLTGRIGLSHHYWGGFSAGMSVAALLIAIGGVVNVAAVLLSRRDQLKGKNKS